MTPNTCTHDEIDVETLEGHAFYICASPDCGAIVADALPVFVKF